MLMQTEHFTRDAFVVISCRCQTCRFLADYDSQSTKLMGARLGKNLKMLTGKAAVETKNG